MVEVVFFGVVAMVAVVPHPQLLDEVWRSAVVVEAVVWCSCSCSCNCSCGMV